MEAPRAQSSAREADLRRHAGAPETRDETGASQSAGAADIRKSRLPEWMRFRYEHSQVALSTEMAVRFELDARVRVRDARAACDPGQPDASVDLDISAEIEIRGRDATVRSWGCDTEHDDARAGAICECLLQQLPSELHVAVPADVRDVDLVPYDGMLSLRL